MHKNTTPVYLTAFLSILASCSSPNQLLPPPNQPAPGFEKIAEQLRGFILYQMESKELPAFAIGLVDRESTLWVESFGNVGSGKEARVPNISTVYRVGSVSKLFTDIAIMRRVEAGELDLDAPVHDYLPETVRLGSAEDAPITLRQLMSHRSGLFREPPVGHYFDASGPTLRQTVESLTGQAPIYAPGTLTKYSNAAIAVVGYVLEHTQGVPFAEYLTRDILDPLSMLDSSFEPNAEISQALADAWMWTYEGRRFTAPRFQLGMAPAGSLYATIPDLCGFMRVLLNRGAGAGFQLLQPSSLDDMWTPQFGSLGSGFGLGFRIGTLEGERSLSHGGAIYGFATQLSLLPDAGFGVVTVTNVDASNSVTTRVADYALRLLLAQKKGIQHPKSPLTAPLDAAMFARLEGDYVGAGDKQKVSIYRQKDQLILEMNGFRVPLQQDEESVVTDGRLTFGWRLRVTQDGLDINGRLFRRVTTSLPSAVPDGWKGLIGSYGWDYNTLYILEKKGRLVALVEWVFESPLGEIGQDQFALPENALYQDETLYFKREASGQATSVAISGLVFPRRPEQPTGTTFRIQSLKPIAQLRADALGADPPVEEGNKREPQLIRPIELAPDIKLDIRYASSNNFMGTPFYREAKAFLQRPAAEALARAHTRLKEQGYGVLIYDAYRPWYVTKMFWDATPEDKKIFVANPLNGSRHNRGCAVDLTLYELASGGPVEMVSGYDEFSERAYPRFPGGTSRQRWLRQLLRSAMEGEGFTVYEAEWWHFDYPDWDQYPILNQTFEELAN